jgi:hypothetical protein
MSDDTLSGGRCKFSGQEFSGQEFRRSGEVEWWSGGVVESSFRKCCGRELWRIYRSRDKSSSLS